MTDYVKGIEYVNDVMTSIYYDEGRLLNVNGTWQSEYVLKDHLGNARVTFRDVDGNGFITASDITQEANYYPFGMQMEGDWSPAAAVRIPYLYNGIEHVSDLGLDINTALFRTLDPALGRWWQIDPKAEEFYAMTPYNSMGNNPMLHNDPNGDWIQTVIGAAIGAWSGWKLGESQGAKGLAMAGYVLGGALVGAASGGVSELIVANAGAFCQTASIAAGSFINSTGMNLLSGGKSDAIIGLGVVLINLSKGSIGFLGKEGNSTLENIGYGMGLLTNISDVLAGTDIKGDVTLVTNKELPDGHSAITYKDAIANDPRDQTATLVSFGPTKIGNLLKPNGGEGVNYDNYNRYGEKVWRTNIKNVNVKKISDYGIRLRASCTENYNAYFSNCVIHTSRALNSAGVWNIGIHPFILAGQMALREAGVRPFLMSYYLYSK